MSLEAYENIKPHINRIHQKIIFELADSWVKHRKGEHYRELWRFINLRYKQKYMPMTISSRLTELRKIRFIETVDSLNYLTHRGWMYFRNIMKEKEP